MNKQNDGERRGRAEMPALSGDDLRLLETIDRAMAGEQPADYGLGSAEGFATHLMASTPPADPGFRMDLASRLLAELQQPEVETSAVPKEVVGRRRLWLFPVHLSPRRAALTALTLLVLVAGLFAVSPQARVLAQDSLDQLLAQFGYSRAPHEQRGPAPARPTANEGRSAPIPEPTREPATPRPPLSLSELQGLVGFAVKEPTYMPAGYREVSPLAPFTDGANKWVIWQAMPTQWEGCEFGISLRQEPVPPQTALRPQTPLGDAPVTVVIVGEAPSLWIEGEAMGICDAVGQDGKTLTSTRGTGNTLVWDQDGTRYRLTTSSSLDLAEALKFAASLRGTGLPVTPVPSNPALQNLRTSHPMLGQVAGQLLRGKLVITFEGHSYAGWSAWATGEVTDPRSAQGNLFGPAIAGLRDSTIPTVGLSDRGDTLGQRYVVVEVWDHQVNIGASGGDASLRQRAVQSWARYFEQIADPTPPR